MNYDALLNKSLFQTKISDFFFDFQLSLERNFLTITSTKVRTGYY